MLNEKKLTKAELDKREDIIMKMKKNKRSLIDKYGKDAEAVMYGRATNMAKKQAESMKKDRINELIKDALTNPKKADLNKDGKLSDYEKTRGAAIEKNIKETLDKDAWGKLERLRSAIDDDDYIITSMMKAMSTDDANLYLDAMIRDHIDLLGYSDSDDMDKMGDEDFESYHASLSDLDNDPPISSKFTEPLAEDHDCEKIHPNKSHEEWVKSEIDNIKRMYPKADKKALKKLAKLKDIKETIKQMRSINEKSYPFDKCLDDNEGKYGKEGAKRVCGSIRAAFGEGLKEGKFDELKKHQGMMSKAADFFRDKAEELDVGLDKVGDFNKGVNALVSAVFDANYKRTGGKIDEVELPVGTAQKINKDITNAASMAQAILTYYDQIQDKEQVNFSKNQKFKIILAKLKELAAASKEEPIEENMVGKVIDGLKAIANSMNFTGNAKQTIDSLEDMGEEEAGEYLSKLFTQRAVSPRKYGRGIDLEEGLPKGYFKKEFGIGKKKKLKEATGPATIEDTQKAARKVATAIQTFEEGSTTEVSHGLDEGSFDIDLDDQPHDGGSYTVDNDGDITLVSIAKPSFIGNINDSPETIFRTMEDVLAKQDKEYSGGRYE